jgi:hypothetical protein
MHFTGHSFLLQSSLSSQMQRSFLQRSFFSNFFSFASEELYWQKELERWS